MKNVLINAYAVSPNWGSEPGMGWNWVINIAKYCNVFVITEGEWRSEIEEAVAKLPQKDNIHFYYNPVPDKVRSMCWNQGDWRFYWYYRKWQQKTLEIAKQIIAENKIDVIHQLNMIGFREPGYLWKIKDIPFVWGPVGGMGNIPTAYLRGAGWKQNVFCRLKNFISNCQIEFSLRVRKAARRGVMLAATGETKSMVKEFYNLDISLLNETGCYPTSNEDVVKKTANTDVFKILWVGKFDFRKQFEQSLLSISKMRNKGLIEFNVISPFSSPSQESQIRELVEKYGLSDVTVLHGRVPNSRVHELMKASDVFFFTSIMEGTPHVVLEAVQNNLPILCFNTCGQGEVVDFAIGDKVDLSDPETSSMEFAQKLDNWVENRDVLIEKSHNCSRKQHECSWDQKVKMVISRYEDLSKKK